MPKEDIMDLLEEKTKLKSKFNELGNEMWRMNCQKIVIGKKMAMIDTRIDNIVSKQRKIRFVRQNRNRNKKQELEPLEWD